MTDADVIKALLSLIAALLTGGAFFLLRAVFENAKRHGSTTSSSNTPKHMMIADLHDWHKPDATGRQDWKNPEIREQMGEIRKSIDQQTKKIGEGQAHIADSIDSMHDTFTGLAEELKK